MDKAGCRVACTRLKKTNSMKWSKIAKSCERDAKMISWLRGEKMNKGKSSLMRDEVMNEDEQGKTSHPRIAHGQRYPMPCLEWSNEVMEWEQGSVPKGRMSCRTQGGISRRPEGAYFRPQMTNLGHLRHIWRLEGRIKAWRANLRFGGQI